MEYGSLLNSRTGTGPNTTTIFSHKQYLPDLSVSSSSSTIKRFTARKPTKGSEVTTQQVSTAADADTVISATLDPKSRIFAFPKPWGRPMSPNHVGFCIIHSATNLPEQKTGTYNDVDVHMFSRRPKHPDTYAREITTGANVTVAGTDEGGLTMEIKKNVGSSPMSYGTVKDHYTVLRETDVLAGQSVYAADGSHFYKDRFSEWRGVKPVGEETDDLPSQAESDWFVGQGDGTTGKRSDDSDDSEDKENGPLGCFPVCR